MFGKAATLARNAVVSMLNPRAQRQLKEYQRSSMTGVWRHLAMLGFAPKLIIDVGVATGTPALENAFPKAHFVWVEPVVDFEPHLKMLSKRLKGRYILAAAGAEAGSREISIRFNKGKPSTSGFPASNDECEKRCVKVIRLDDLDEAQATTGETLIKVDVQGAELEVLDGAQRLLRDACEAVILEVSLFQFQSQSPTFEDVVDYMRERDFAVYDLCGRKYREYDGAPAQIDILFVRRDGRFRETHQYHRSTDARMTHGGN